MSLKAWERATLNFYDWDYLGRGYYLYDSRVGIEPPYKRFEHSGISDNVYIDDGRVPNILEQIIGLFHSTKPDEVSKEPEPSLRPNPSSLINLEVGFSLSFPKEFKTSKLISKEFLEMLSFSEAPISFEVLGTLEMITVQIICSHQDKQRVESHLIAYFQEVVIKAINPMDLPFNLGQEVAICDLGLNDEFVRPISASKTFDIDPLTSIIATVDNLRFGEVALFQVIFHGVSSPWAQDIPYAVTDGSGESFFADSPEMIDCAKEKVSAPLFGCVMRIATQSNSKNHSHYLADQLSDSITASSKSSFNMLIPLTNKGYSYDDHLYNLYHRTSNRAGMILNSDEMATFVHYPHKSVNAKKLGLSGGKTKQAPPELLHNKYVWGENEYRGIRENVSVDDETRLRHTHIIGATGVGKSTLIANMIFEDLKQGNGCALFDPHGDIVEDVLARIPDSRKNDVVLIDPSDIEYPIGFNLLQANSEIEQIVLSSDLVSIFKQHASTWGDNMTAVLSNAINTFLENDAGGTLLELKRFLLEDNFRNAYLKEVMDPSIHYYWKHEYPMMKKGISPLLTRIDTFLRPRMVRYMMAQKSGIDFRSCIENNKIVLINLSQGLIGQENSYLLGSLFLSKLNQAALNRQSLVSERRHPFYLYIDEFEAFLTPSIISILSGARKYGLGLILAHQELAQLDDPKILNSVISNPNIRICFRLGDYDAKRLANGFSSFEHEDFQNLAVGNAIMRVGSSNNDFNIQTLPLPEVDQNLAKQIKEHIIEHSRNQFASPRSKVEVLVNKLLPKHHSGNQEREVGNVKENNVLQETPVTEHSSSIENEKQKFLGRTKQVEEIRNHKKLQNYVRALATQRNFKATIEEVTENGGRVDIGLRRDKVRIAIEISVTNTLDYEVQNIVKCLKAGYNKIYMVSESMVHLKNIRLRANQVLEQEQRKYVEYLTPLELSAHLDSYSVRKSPNSKKIRGYRIKSNHRDIDSSTAQEKNKSLQNIILSRLKAKNKNRPKQQ